MSDPASQADELRTPEEKSRSAEVAPEAAAPDGALEEEPASGPGAPGEQPDPLPEAALFGEPDPALSAWIATADLPAQDLPDAPEVSGTADPLGTDLPWDPASPPPEGFASEMSPQRYGAGAWDLGDPSVAAWVSWCEDQGLDPYDPDLLAWANWYYQEQLEGRAVPADAAPVPDAVASQPGEAFHQASSDEWSADAPVDFVDALHAEGPGSFGSPPPDLSAVLARAEEDEQVVAAPADLDDGAADALASFGAEPASSANDFGISSEGDLGPILEVGVDVFEVFDDELAAPPEWIPPEPVSSEPTSEPVSSEPISSEPFSSGPISEPISSQPILQGSPSSEPASPEPEPQVLDAAAFGMVALDSPQAETALFDLEQAAASLAEIEASLQQQDGAATSFVHDAPATAEQRGHPAQESDLGPMHEIEAAREPEPADAPPPEPHEPTSSFTAEPESPADESYASAHESGAEPAQVAGTHRVVVHTVEGEVKRGTVTDIVLEGRDVSLDLQNGETQSIPLERIRAVFFMLDEGESPPAPEGTQVRVTFRDGRQVAGVSPDYHPDRSGFFVIPADASSRTARIWVYRTAVRQISVT